MMHRSACLTVTLLIMGLSGAAHGWGGYGHEAIGAIAETRLSPESRREVRELLVGKTLQTVATWADAVRPKRRETGPLHYINFPPDLDVPRSEDLSTSVGNVYVAITGYSERLADRSRPHAERAEALMFLTHFVGDLHQPLHCGLAEDLGGNLVGVRDRGRESNLHRVWDSGILSLHLDMSPEELGDMLLSSATSETLAAYAGEREVESWIRESRAVVKSRAYNLGTVVCEPAVAEEYLQYNLPVAEQRILAAGIRLGDLVDTILTTGRSPLPPPPVSLPEPRDSGSTATLTESPSEYP